MNAAKQNSDILNVALSSLIQMPCLMGDGSIAQLTLKACTIPCTHHEML